MGRKELHDDTDPRTVPNKNNKNDVVTSITIGLCHIILITPIIPIILVEWEFSEIIEFREDSDSWSLRSLSLYSLISPNLYLNLLCNAVTL